ncbi:Pantothenate kinase 1 [Hypsibius exemplaris]|uniref:Pantothenate kinase 1 n=1 Tax=Hypsibius exemplaris TaxID=2072580 RepID=A0A1W0WBJ4_HYPEX|nr:Pantothenate kinase 1 [Hypsibius exemplaris]
MSVNADETTLLGVDLGNSLAKVVYFEPEKLGENCHLSASNSSSKAIRDYITSKTTYDEVDGVREESLTIPGVPLNDLTGSLHFIRFPVIELDTVIGLMKTKGLPAKGITITATGMGSYVNRKDFEEMEVDYRTADEFTTQASGLVYLLQHSPKECYYFENPSNEELCRKVHVEKDHLTYPYLLVTVGSATSICLVTSPKDFTVIGGSSIGGAMFLGLCCLVTPAKNFDEAMALAKRGNHKGTVDKVIGEVGSEYLQLRSGYKLPPDFVLVSFGHMLDPEQRKAAKPEDLARSLLATITTVVGAAVGDSVRATGVKQVLFVGSFFGNNDLAKKQITAMQHFVSQGAVNSFFIEHEGYCSAVGALVEHDKVKA